MKSLLLCTLLSTMMVSPTSAGLLVPKTQKTTASIVQPPSTPTFRFNTTMHQDISAVGMGGAGWRGMYCFLAHNKTANGNTVSCMYDFNGVISWSQPTTAESSDNLACAGNAESEGILVVGQQENAQSHFMLHGDLLWSYGPTSRNANLTACPASVILTGNDLALMSWCDSPVSEYTATMGGYYGTSSIIASSPMRLGDEYAFLVYTIMFEPTNGTFYAVRTEGSGPSFEAVVWSHPVSSTTKLDGNKYGVVVVDASPSSLTVKSLNVSTGTTVWEMSTTKAATTSDAAYGLTGSYFCMVMMTKDSSSSVLTCTAMNNSSMTWSVTMPAAAANVALAFGATAVIATSTKDNKIWAFNPVDGALLWEVSTLLSPTKGTVFKAQYQEQYYFGHQDPTTDRVIYSSVVV